MSPSPPRAVLFALALLTGCADDAPPPPPSGYCYQTLADVNCYTKPDPGREGRLTGVLPAQKAEE